MLLNRVLALRSLSVVVMIFLGIATAILGAWSGSQGQYSGNTESITFGAIPSGSAGLIYIAQERGFFAANGLTVSVEDYPTGVATTDALLRGDVDISEDGLKAVKSGAVDIIR